MQHPPQCPQQPQGLHTAPDQPLDWVTVHRKGKNPLFDLLNMHRQDRKLAAAFITGAIAALAGSLAGGLTAL